MADDVHKALTTAILRVLRPLVRILLRHGISYGTFAETAKWVFVDVATEDFAIPGRKQSVSRVSVLTGLSRKEVSRVHQLPRPDDQETIEQHNRAARVVGGWLHDADFADPDGAPAGLDFEDGESSFSELVKRYSGDVPARAVLDELSRVGAVDRDADGRIVLKVRAFVPQGSEADKLHILGVDAGSLMTTIDHNLDPEQPRPYLQRKVEYDNLPDEALEPFRELASGRAQELLLQLNDWLAKHDRDATPSVGGTGRNRAGLGIYYFEEPLKDRDDS
jgi:hypothetical protein